MPDLSVLTQRSFAGLTLSSVKEAPAWMNIFLYGDPGAGKTVLAGSSAAVADMSPVLIGDCEGGAFSLKAFYPEVDVVRIKNTAELVQVYQTLLTTDHGYKTFVLDSLSEVNKMIMGDIMKAVVEEDEERDPDVPSIREWGKLGEQMRRVIRRFRDLPMHTIFTALLNEEQDAKGRVKKNPMLSGKLKKEVAGFMDIVLFVYAKHVKVNLLTGEPDQDGEEGLHRFVLSSSTDEFICKDRSSLMPEVMLDPTMTKIHTLIQGV